MARIQLHPGLTSEFAMYLRRIWGVKIRVKKIDRPDEATIKRGQRNLRAFVEGCAAPHQELFHVEHLKGGNIDERI